MKNGSPIRYIQELGDAFESAITSGNRQMKDSRSSLRSKRIVAIASACFLVLSIVIGVMSTSPKASAVIQVDRDDDELIVRLLDVEAEPSQVREAIKESGLDVELIAVPVSPSLVGRFIASYATDASPQLEILESDGVSYRAFRIPADFTGRLELYIGRKTEVGENYEASGSAYGPGEPLECSGLYGRTVRDSLPVLDKLGLRIRWQTAQESAEGVAMVEVTPKEIPGFFVMDAISVAPGEVLIFAAPTPESPFANGLGNHDLSCR